MRLRSKLAKWVLGKKRFYMMVESTRAYADHMWEAIHNLEYEIIPSQLAVHGEVNQDDLDDLAWYKEHAPLFESLYNDTCK